MNKTPFDARAIANLLLDESDRLGHRVTNLALQKLIYFSHCIFLIRNKFPLVNGYFEAWQYGPVHPTVYKAFKAAGSVPVTFRAHSCNVLTGETLPIPAPQDISALKAVTEVVSSFGGLSAGRLVDISHAKNSPWDFIVDKSRTSVALGLRIPDNVIIDRFKYHKIPVNLVSQSGDPGEDTPFT